MTENNRMKEMPVNRLMMRMGLPMILSMALQAVWLVLLAAAGKALMNRALRRVVVQGG